MDKNKMIGLGMMAAGLLLISGIVYVIFFYDFGPRPEIGTEEVKPAATSPSNETANLPENPLPEPEKQVFEAKIEANQNSQLAPEAVLPEALIKKIAVPFAEKYGTYSNQSDYENISDLFVFMTDKMKAAEQARIEKMKLGNQDFAEYQGMTTISAGFNLASLSEDGNQAVAVVSAKRLEKKGDSSVDTYWNATLNFVKSGDSWLVDSLEWKEID